MKNIAALTLAATLSISTAFAGGLAPTIIEDEPVIQTKPASSVSPLVILGLLILIGVLVSRNDDGEDNTPTELPDEELPVLVTEPTNNG